MAATSSCVFSGEQNELVVRTGSEVRLRKLDVEMLKWRDVSVISSDPAKLYSLQNYIKDIALKEVVHTSSSILFLNKELRNKSIIICFNEPSYSGKQSLYHTFGHLIPSFELFNKLLNEIQKTGDAVVFGLDELMWFPGIYHADGYKKFNVKCNDGWFSEKYHMNIPSLVNLKKQADDFNMKHSVSLREQLIIVCEPNANYSVDWVNMVEKLINRLEKEKVYISVFIRCVGSARQYLSYSYPDKDTRRAWDFDIDQEWTSSSVFAWLMEKRKLFELTEKKEEKPQESAASQEATAFQEVMNKITPSLKIQEEPDIKSQVATLTETIKTLTDVVSKLTAKL